MSVPFSNTNLRVPRGFGTILEGLAREVLRDQPDDIPAYAVQYFDKLLKQREESGMDPAEWAARLEDRFYNNHAFKSTETVSPEKETAAEETGSKEKTDESRTEEEANPSEEEPNLSPKNSLILDTIDSDKRTDDEEHNDPTEKLPVSLELRHTEKTSTANNQSDEQSGTDKDDEFTNARPNQVDRPDDEVDVNPAPDCTIPELDSDLSNVLPGKDISNVDMCFEEVEATGYERQNQRDGEFEDKKNVSSEGKKPTQVAEAFESLQYFAYVDVDVFASELGGTKETLEDDISQDDTQSAEEKVTMKRQLEENSVELLPSQYEIPQDNQQEAEYHAQKPNERVTTETEASHEKTDESSENSLNNNVLPKEDSLVEISIDGVPDEQCNNEVLEKNTDKDISMEDALTYMSALPETDELKELVPSSTDMVGTKDQHKTEIIKMDSISEEEEPQSHHPGFDTLRDTSETNYLNYTNDDERKIDGNTPILENEIKDHETDHKNEHIEELFDDRPDLNRKTKEIMHSDVAQEDETTKTVYTEGYSEMGNREINNSRSIQSPSQLIKSDTAETEIVTENETMEENQEDGPEKNQQSPRIIGESQSEDIEEEKQDAFKEEEIANSEVQEQSEELGKEETVTPTDSADWTAADHKEEERPAVFEEDTKASENKSEKQEECSRPQEEEDIMDIPLDDPEANRAAAKIQAGFRGHMTRKKMKPEDKTEGEEVSSTGDVLNSSQGGSETGRSGAVERDDTSVPEQ